MRENLTDRQVDEIIKARYDSESPRKLTNEEKVRADKVQKELSEMRIKKANEYAEQIRKGQLINC